MDKIINKIQTELKAPKGQFNKFGNFKYRSCEDILESLKPLLRETGAYLTINDDIVNFGERYYIKATATLAKDGKSLSATAYARETDIKKGMDASQITGATSSYARKYALNGLFAIDDTKDADHNGTKDDREKLNNDRSLTPEEKSEFVDMQNAIENASTIEELNKLTKGIKSKVRKLPPYAQKEMNITYKNVKKKLED